LKESSELYQERTASLQKHHNLIKQLFNDAEDISSLPAEEQVNWQLAAVVSGVLNSFTIITGGPGTGKTTTVARLLAVLYTLNPDLSVALAAPTGKAAMRMGESLKSARLNIADAIVNKFQDLLPTTVHRLLKTVPNTPYFRHNAAHPLLEDVIIVDEASMLDAALFAKLLNAVGPETRLILLGDKDQLASVEAGSLLGDLCQVNIQSNMFGPATLALINELNNQAVGSIPEEYLIKGKIPLLAGNIVELKRSRRFSSQKGIGKMSRAVIQSNLKELNDLMAPAQDNEILVDHNYDEAIFEQFVAGYESYLFEPNPMTALQKFNEIKILCAIRGGEQGVVRINKKVEDLLRKKQLIHTATDFYHNRPIMITSNYYDLGLFNGDIGIIRPDASGVLKAWFETGQGELRELLPAYIPYAETVYAMTVHKSQGSEYDRVLVVLPKVANENLLTRELLYTAVTRAKKQVIVQGTTEQILSIANASVQRASGLQERFREMDQLINT
jgi:exodeoxyribonuclease V alpha subunit